MKYTSRYRLKQPESTDFYNVDDFNENMGIIDGKLDELEMTKALSVHSHNKSEVGLENVPNVTTNNQTPTYSMASSNTNLTSGEKLSTAFGKIAKAINSLINHLGSTSNPHSVTKSQVGLGNVDNTSDANKPVSTAMQTALDNHAGSTTHITASERLIWNAKAPKASPVFTGSISLGRKSDTTTGTGSFAVGLDVEASADYAQAEGSNTVVSAMCGHAEGGNTSVSARYGHAEGYYTKAGSKFQHVQGKYNVEDTSDTYAHIVGGGTSATPKNIHTLDWNGNAVYAGDVTATDANGKLASLLDMFSKSTTFQQVTSSVGTIVAGGYVQIGKLVIVSLQITLNKDASSNSTDIVNGLPFCESTYAMLHTMNATRGKFMDCYVATGNARVVTTDNTLITSGNNLFINGAYMAKYSNL